MEYHELYTFAEKYISARKEAGKRSVIVSVIALKEYLIENVSWLDGINFHPVDCRSGDPYGHFECYGNEESRWEDPDAWTVLITYNNDEDVLNECYQRFVWCKELMHIFDTEEGCVNTGERYVGFLQEIELRPIDKSEMYISENTAKWMALLVLCPMSHRNDLIEEKKRDDISDYEIALRYRIPEVVVASLFSPYYDDSHEYLIQNENNA